MSYPWMPVGRGDDTWVPTNLITGEYEARRYATAAECIAACEDIAQGEADFACYARGLDSVRGGPGMAIFI